MNSIVKTSETDCTCMDRTCRGRKADIRCKHSLTLARRGRQCVVQQTGAVAA